MATVELLGKASGKSMPYDTVPELRIGSDGLIEGDHVCAWVEAAEHVNPTFQKGKIAVPGQALTRRNDPELAGIYPVVGEDGITLWTKNENGMWLPNLPVPYREDIEKNRLPVKIWGWRGEAIDMGDEVADWGRDIFGRPVRLVALSQEKPRYVEDRPELGRAPFTDGYPVTVGAVESFDLINGVLAEHGVEPIALSRPRATMLLAGLRPPFEVPEKTFLEDFVASVVLKYEGQELILQLEKACGRCIMMNQIEATAELIKGPTVLAALGKLGRLGAHTDTTRFGTDPDKFWTQNAIIRLPKNMPPDFVFKIIRGAKVEVTYRNTPNWVTSSARQAA
jgi:uncharacterized protein YcbX